MARAAVEARRLGQSIWEDHIQRSEITSGELARRIEHEGLGGLTSNPTLFAEAIEHGSEYDADLRALVARGVSQPGEIFERLALDDIRAAARAFEPLFRHTGGRDGFVSYEVSPHLAHDTEATVREALRLFAAIGRPNVMIKVPGTREGVPAISRLVAGGVNVNVTLLFAIDAYAAAAEAWLTGLERRAEAERELGSVHGVASFFVSRIDTAVDRRLSERLDQVRDAAERARLGELLGKAGIANAKLAYERFRATLASPRWQALAARGATPQRVLWASTSTKDPRYPELLYAESLIGPDTVDTLPVATLRAFQARGRVRATLSEGLEEARQAMGELAAAGVRFREVTDQLLAEGVEKFARSYDELLEAIGRKRDALGAAAGEGASP